MGVMVIAAILLLVAALACVAAKLFLPSHGILAIVAGLLAILGVIAGYRAEPALGVLIAAVVLVGTPVVFFWAIKLYPHTPMGKRVMLKAPPPGLRDPFSEETERLAALVGRHAVAATMLRPAGTIEVDGHRIDAVSESEVIAPGTRVEILRVTGLRVIVKPVT